MMQMQSERDELEQKRLRNRLAQQKYRKRLKLHIADLEKRAAAAGDLQPKTKANSNTLAHDDMNSIYPYSTQLVGHGGAAPIYQPAPSSVSLSQTYEPIAVNIETSSSFGRSNSPISVLKKPGHVRQESLANPPKDMMSITPKPASSQPDDYDFMKAAFSLSEDTFWGNQADVSFQGVGDTDVQSDNVKMVESPQLTTRQVVLGPSNSPGSLSTKLGLSGSAPSPVRMPTQEHGNRKSNTDETPKSVDMARLESPDTFVSSYFTGLFKDLSAVKMAQIKEASSSTGLSHVPEELRAKTSSRSMWESNIYKDTVLRSSASLVAEEFDRLGKKNYSCEIELQQYLSRTAQDSVGGSPPLRQLHSTAAELKKTLRDELPNLYVFISTLLAQDSPLPQSTRVQLLLATIEMITTSGDEPLPEAANWVYNRANSRLPANYGEGSGEELEGDWVIKTLGES